MKKSIIALMLLIGVICNAGDDKFYSYTGQEDGYQVNHFFIFADPTYEWTSTIQFPYEIKSIAVSAATAITNTLTLSVARNVYDKESDLTYSVDMDIWSAAVSGDADIVYSEPVNGFRIKQGDVLTWTKTDATAIATSTVTDTNGLLGTVTVTDTNAAYTVDAYNLGYSAVFNGLYYDIVDTASNTLTLGTSVVCTNGDAYSIVTPIKVIIDGEK